MPLLVLTGQPSSGKSTAASAIVALLEAAGQGPVCLIDEPSLHLSRDAAYATPTTEKATRGALRSATEAAVTKRTVVILDSLNNIKGYRYELWCIARAAGTRYAVLHVDTPQDTAAAWNASRPPEQRYSDATFADLAGRYEIPDARNRWDAPLFTLRPGAADAKDVIAAAAAAVAGAPVGVPTATGVTKESPTCTPCDGGEGSVATALHQGTLRGELVPTLATSNPALQDTNVLHEIDAAVQSIIARVLEAQQLAPGGSAGGVLQVQLGEAGRLLLPRHVSLAELRRHKRTFLKLATRVTFSRLQGAAVAQRSFVDYLSTQLQGGV